MAAVAQWERRTIGERTSAALQVAKRNGKHVGRIPVLSDATAERVLELHHSGLSAGRIASRLNEEGTPAALGGRWYASTVAKTLARISSYRRQQHE
jgi:DNA invertase Pin-like site-specific DNA recombinase